MGKHRYECRCMTRWIAEALGGTTLNEASTTIGRSLLADINDGVRPAPSSTFNFVAHSLELAAFGLLDEPDRRADLRSAADRAFDFLRTLGPEASGQFGIATHLLHTACYGILADRTPDVSRFLKESTFPQFTIDQSDWCNAVLQSVTVLWLKLLRKNGWEDLDAVLAGVISLRGAQATYEGAYLGARGDRARSAAWELVATYHLAKAAEILATFSAQGSIFGAFDIREQLQGQFDRSITACERAEIIDLYSTTKLLARTAEQMVANSIWTVTRAVNSP
jgi:hypothetical protein